MEDFDNTELDSFRSSVEYELSFLEERLKSVLRSDIPLLNEICTSLNSSPGKRIRPNVLFLAARNVKGDLEKAITAGFSVELIHTATLIHDDIIDGHDFRRGNLTISARWGRNIATIMGDFLYSKAFSCLSEEGLTDAMAILAKATNAMSVGEMLQFQQKRDVNVSEAGYLNLINMKTASLFSAACECGAALGVSGNGYRTKYSMFGENMGLAYQITDDLFDFIASESTIGKPVASDLTAGKVTLPFITSYQNAPDNIRKRIGEIFNGGLKKENHWKEVMLFVQNYGGIEYSIEKARSFGRKAKVYLKSLSPSPEIDALGYAADYVVERVAPYSG